MSKEVTVVGTGYDGEEAVKLYQKYHPDIVLIDIQMKGIDGIEAAKQILKNDEKAKILFLTTFSDDEYIVKALQIGVKGYLLKQDYESILPALKAVESGQTVFGDEIMTKLPTLMGEKREFDYISYDITEKEMSIIKLVAEGESNKEIAEELYLSEGTVRNYLSEILNKLELRDRTQLAVFYYKNRS
ncbi:two-component response regulator [Lachnospiraceae bacterium KM106-2]|nr:two-component response regulator [Lachnospiraceae bacterium KM106-2]